MFCNHVWINNLTVRSVGVPNGDGIDPDSSQDVLIENSDLATGDDCIGKPNDCPTQLEAALSQKSPHDCFWQR